MPRPPARSPTSSRATNASSAISTPTDGPLCLVLVGALFVGSIETVFAGEINPPPGRGGKVRVIEPGVGRTFRRGEELGRFNMGSTVIVLTGAARGFCTARRAR